MSRPYFPILFAALLALPSAAMAEQKIYSYTPSDPVTRRLVEQGLTFVFDKNFLGFRVKEVMATQASASALVDPVDEREMGGKLDVLLPAGAFERELYSIRTDAEEGGPMVRAFCPGSTKGWLVFGPLRPRKGLVVHVLGDNPAAAQPRLCATMNFDFKGEWAVPLRDPRIPDPSPFITPQL